MRGLFRPVRAASIVAALSAALSPAALSLEGCSYLAPRKLASGPAAVEGTIVFRFYDPSARRVQIAGDWPENNWGKGDGSVGEANIGLMEDGNGDGIWEIAVALGPGRYKYLFWVDESRWFTDPGSPEEVSGGPAGKCSQLVLFSKDGKLEIR